MAGGKVSEWIRKRTMPRRRKARSGSSASAPILEEVTETRSRRAGPMPGKADRGGSGGGRGARFSKVSAALRWRPRVNVLAVLFDKAVYHLLWLVESVVVVARLCFFLMRFGLKQL